MELRKGGYNDIKRITEERWCRIREHSHWSRFFEIISLLEAEQLKTTQISLDGDCPTLGGSTKITATSKELIREAIKLLIPWRTGPYSLFGEVIDAEWRSFMKFDRIKPLLPNLTGKSVADIGAGNGYFSFRLSTLNPASIVGFEPIDRCLLQYTLLNKFINLPNISLEPLKLEELDLFPHAFDLILCMGVLYHQRDPKLAIRKLCTALTPGAQLILETIVLPGEGRALDLDGNSERYAMMRNVWTIPTAQILIDWCEEAGLNNIKIKSLVPSSTLEQRRTEYAPYQSLSDFLDAQNPERTVEGHPAPWRVIVMAER